MGKFDHRGPRAFYSGRELEADTFGSFKVSREYKLALQEAADAKGYVTRGRAIDLIEKFYEADPENPSKEFATDLRIEVMDLLGITEDELVHFYTSVGTPLDIFHGIDAYLRIRDAESGQAIRYTLDVTANTDKVSDGHKADLIIGEIPAPDEDGYLSTVEGYAAEIAREVGGRLAELKKKVPAVQPPTLRGRRSVYVPPPAK